MSERSTGSLETVPKFGKGLFEPLVVKSDPQHCSARLRNKRSCYNLVYVGQSFDQYETYQLKRSVAIPNVSTLPNVASRRECHLRRVLPVSPMLLGPKNQPILPACRDDLGDGRSGNRMHTLWSRLVGFHYFATSVQSCFIRPDLTTADPICSSAHS